jgi:hypothetical protein
VRLRGVIAAALVALLAAGGAGAATVMTTELVPGVVYKREVRVGPDGPLIVHSIAAPKPGGAYELKPVLSNGLVLGRESLTEMQRRLGTAATVAGVNGDLFSFETGHPSGIFLENGALENRPLGGRSSLGIGLDGLLRIGRIDFFGTWRIGDGPASPLSQFNRPLDAKDKNVAALYTWTWGGYTPKEESAVDLVLTGFPAPVPNTDLTSVISEVRFGGGSAIPQGGAVLQARGFWGDKAAFEAVPGLPVTTQLILRPWWDGISHAIGGGPLIIRDGQPVDNADEDFTSDQLNPRHPRTAVGQRADGRILLVAVDGRSRQSRGLRLPELAREMIRLGAVNAMALDAGGSTEIAFDGRVLNKPSDGAERPLGDALMIFYYGAWAPEPLQRVVSPNGDGVADVQKLGYKVVRPSTVDVQLIAPDDTVVWSDSGLREPGLYPVSVDPAVMLQEQGKYRWVVSAVDADGQVTGQTRTFSVNSTLGFLKLSKRFMRVRSKTGGKLTTSFELEAPAWLRVRVVNDDDEVIRKLYAHREDESGPFVLIWDGRDARKKAVPTGRYTIRVEAANKVGVATLERHVAVKRMTSSS